MSGKAGIVTTSPMSRPASAASTISTASMRLSAGIAERSTPALPQSSVRVAPGNTAWTRMPVFASSLCSPMLRFSAKDLVPLYTALNRSGASARTEETLISVLRPRATKPSTAACAKRNAAVMLMFTIASSRSTSEPCIGPATATPALFTQHAHGRVLRQPVFDPQQIRRRRQVRRQNVYGTAGLGTQACGQSVQPGFIAGHQDQVIAAARQTVGVDGANAGGSAGDERGVGIRHCGTPPVGVIDDDRHA